MDETFIYKIWAQTKWMAFITYLVDNPWLELLTMLGLELRVIFPIVLFQSFGDYGSSSSSLTTESMAGLK